MIYLPLGINGITHQKSFFSALLFVIIRYLMDEWLRWLWKRKRRLAITHFSQGHYFKQPKLKSYNLIIETNC